MEEQKVVSKSSLARSLGVSRSALYYVPRKEKKDWALKGRIESVLREHPSYGSRRLAQALRLNRKGVQRVMRVFGIKPYRRRGRKWRKKRAIAAHYANLLLNIIPAHPHHVWAADFTELWHRGKWVYVATVIDLFTRRIVGMAVSLRKGAPLTVQALWAALLHHPHPEMFHSDNGAAAEVAACAARAGIRAFRERSHAQSGCPAGGGNQSGSGEDGRSRSISQ